MKKKPMKKKPMKKKANEEKANEEKQNKEKSLGDSGSIFTNKTFCLSGVFTTTQIKIKKIILNNGGKILNDIKDEVNFLLIGKYTNINIETRKYKEAASKNVMIIQEAFIHDCIKKKINT